MLLRVKIIIKALPFLQMLIKMGVAGPAMKTSLEALMLGKPIIQFDRGDFLNYDPLFDFIEFKWQVSKESPLNNALNEIQNLPDTCFEKYQKRGRKYVEDYFYPVTKDRLSLFLPNADC